MKKLTEKLLILFLIALMSIGICSCGKTDYTGTYKTTSVTMDGKTVFAGEGVSEDAFKLIIEDDNLAFFLVNNKTATLLTWVEASENNLIFYQNGNQEATGVINGSQITVNYLGLTITGEK